MYELIIKLYKWLKKSNEIKKTAFIEGGFFGNIRGVKLHFYNALGKGFTFCIDLN